MLALNLAVLSANLLGLFQGGGLHLGETRPMAGPAGAKTWQDRAVVAPRSDHRIGVAAGSSGLLAAEAHSRYPPSVGEPHVDGYLEEFTFGVHPPRARSRGVPPYRRGDRNPTLLEISAASEGKPASPLPPDVMETILQHFLHKHNAVYDQTAIQQNTRK
jgi:hypothetical protein